MTTDRIYKVDVSILLRPVQSSNKSPTCRISLNNEIIDTTLTADTWFDFTYSNVADTSVKLIVEHYGQVDSDTTANSDVAVIVEQIKFNGIASPRVVWEGIYRPNYPEHLKDSPAELRHANYLGWNGIWSLGFTLPIFTWIHKVEGLGWIYD